MDTLVEQVIVQTFEEKAGKWQNKQEKPKAILFKFSLKVDSSGTEEGYRHLEMLIFAPMNYVGVYVRELWDVIPLEDLEYSEKDDEYYVKKGKDYIKGASEWKLVAYHDSGWRSDGVHRILWDNRHKIQGFSGPSFYTVIDPPAEILALTNQ